MSSGLEKYLADLVKKVGRSEVRAGFISGATYPGGESVAQIAYQNEYGVPENNQPPRPFFRAAVAENKEEWVSAISRGISSGRDADDVLDIVGARMANDIQQSIASLVDPPLSPATIAIRRDKALRQAQNKPVNQSTKPLVDTGVMINSVSHEVVDD